MSSVILSIRLLGVIFYFFLFERILKSPLRHVFEKLVTKTICV